jgi:hypothetical protein
LIPSNYRVLIRFKKLIKNQLMHFRCTDILLLYSDRTIALGSNQPLVKMSTRNIS